MRLARHCVWLTVGSVAIALACGSDDEPLNSDGPAGAAGGPPLDANGGGGGTNTASGGAAPITSEECEATLTALLTDNVLAGLCALQASGLASGVSAPDPIVACEACVDQGGPLSPAERVAACSDVGEGCTASAADVEICQSALVGVDLECAQATDQLTLLASILSVQTSCSALSESCPAATNAILTNF